MPRPPKCRRITRTPESDYFKPRGVPMLELAEVVLSLEGLEALRLADVEGMTMARAARHMGVSRHTFGRVLAGARQAVAQALTKGRALRIEGGHYEIMPDCPKTRRARRPPCARVGAGQTEPEQTMSQTQAAKVAVTSEGPTLDDAVDPRFGRAGGFVVVDVETMDATYVDNGGSQAMSHGAGIQAAENVAKAGAGAVLTGYVGPKAFAALQAAGIAVIQDLSGMTVRQAVEQYASGKTMAADAPNK